MIDAGLRFYVDWNGDDDFADDYEEITSYVRNATWSRGRNLAQQVPVSTAGACTLTLDNRDGRFSSFLSTGPIYGNILPRRKVRITSTHGTNRWTYSEDVANDVGSAWAHNNMTATANDYTAPNGLETADTLFETTDNAYHYLNRNGEANAVSVDEGQPVTYSFYFSYLWRQYVFIEIYDGVDWDAYGIVDIQNGSVYSKTASMTSLTITASGLTGWYRVTATATMAATGYSYCVPIAMQDASTLEYAGDVTKGFHMWGAQCEPGVSVAGGYDKTEGTAHPVTLTQWTGFLDTIEPRPALNLNHTAILTASGPLAIVNATTASVAMQTSIDTDDAVDLVLDAIDWPAGDRAMDTAATNTNMARWWAGGINALTALREIEETESGFIWEGKDGKINFEGKFKRSISPLSIYAASIDTAVHFNAVRQIDPVRGIINSAKAKAAIYDLTGTIRLYTYAGDPPSIADDATLTVWANITQADPSYRVISVSSWATATFTANSASNGSGDDETSNCTLTKTEFDTSCKIEILNEAGHTVYITSLYIDGIAVIQRDDQKASAEDATSQTKYQLREVQYRGRFLTDLVEAQAWCDDKILYYKNPRVLLSLNIPGHRSSIEMNEILTRDISDCVMVTSISALFNSTVYPWIESMAFSVDASRELNCQITLAQSYVRTDGWSSAAYTPSTYIPSVTSLPDGSASLGAAATNKVSIVGRLIVRTLASDPKDATPGNRPAGSVGEVAYYSGKLYICTNAGTPTWELITSS